MKNLNDMGTEKLSRLIMRLSLPAICGMLVNLLYNIVDRIFVGALNSDALAAITAVAPYMTLLSGFAVLVGTGAAALISIKLGEKKPRIAEKILATSLPLLLILSAIIMVLSFGLQDFILSLSGSEKLNVETITYAKDYLFVIILGVPFQLISLGMDQNMRAEGNAKAAMLAMICGAVTNIALDPLFIFTFGLGTRGAAIATVIGQMVTSAYIFWFYFGGKSHLPLDIKNVHFACSARILKLGMPQFLIQLASAAIMLVYNFSLTWYGAQLDPVNGPKIALAALGIIMSVSQIVMMPLNGLSQGFQPIVGYNYGAKQYMRVKKTYLLAVLYGSLWMFLGFLAAELFPRQILMIFNREDQVLLDFGSQALRIISLFLPLIAFQTLSSNYFLAVERPGSSIFLSISRQGLLFIPLILLLPVFLPDSLKLYGVIWASPVADVISAIIAAIYFIFEFRRLNRLQKEHDERLLSAEE